MSLKKKYLKTKPICKVKFELNKDTIGSGKKVYVVGEFNDWDETANSLKKQKNGSYSTTLDLPQGQHYQFRYLIDGSRWENDPDADEYCSNNVCGADNSIVKV